jgi:DNA-binding transcriptional regulator YhcF (GntR family)
MDFSKSQSIYMQIADHISEQILAGQLQAGDKVLSVREMATNIAVNPNTVMRTYSYLQEQDIIFNKRGIGYFVSDTALQKTRAMKKKTFIEQYLPHFFKSMDLLDIKFEDLKMIYDDHTKTKSQ